MPGGFTTDGLPIGLELLGGAWTEATLLKYAYAWEQATKPRRAPFSTPPLVKGVAPAPAAADIAIGAATVKLNYDGRPGRCATTSPRPTCADRSRGGADHSAQRRRQAGPDRRALAGAKSDLGERHADLCAAAIARISPAAGYTCISIRGSRRSASATQVSCGDRT